MTSNSWWDGEKFLKEIFSSMGKKDAFHKIEQLVRTTPTNLNEEDIYKIRARGRSVLSMLDQKRKTRTLLFSAIGALLAIAVIISMAIFVIIPAIKANQTPEPTVEPTVAATTPPTQEPTFAPAETPEPTAIPESSLPGYGNDLTHGSCSTAGSQDIQLDWINFIDICSSSNNERTNFCHLLNSGV